ncbi:hypothetical protein DX933_05540 [Ornithinibacillus gellani]|uniref:hypothetical protein n=1 Tax=Ornithinibacillus gellani TaxID=2293253 RepID=UPI000F49CFD1|nr:hypothetical protein [Ornithinibacillus gellani]TQS75737.1 hypothetical protein DX933_05540 [Ornithinibacillus gellani]
MNKSIQWVLLVFLFVLLTGCNQDGTTQGTKPKPTYQLVTQENVSQDPANQTKLLLQNKEDIKQVHAVNTTKEIVVAIDVPQMKRFQLKNIQKTTKAELKKAFPKAKIHLSADKKIILEVKKLENELQHQAMSSKHLQKQVKAIVQLMKEQT